MSYYNIKQFNIAAYFDKFQEVENWLMNAFTTVFNKSESLQIGKEPLKCLPL